MSFNDDSDHLPFRMAQSAIHAIKLQIDSEFGEKNAAFLTWHIRIGAIVTQEIMDYASSKGLFSTVEQFGVRIGYETLIVASVILDENEDGMLTEIRRLMKQHNYYGALYGLSNLMSK